MRRIVLCVVMAACMAGVFAQVEEIPAMRSQEAAPSVEAESVFDSTARPGSPASTGREALTEEEHDQMRSFLTVNTMIIVIVILICVLALFLIVSRARRSKQQ